MNKKQVLQLLYYQKQILILESSIKSLSAYKITTIDLKFKIFELQDKIKLLTKNIENNENNENNKIRIIKIN